MRLLAFSILEEQESNITKKIEQLFSMLASDNLSANMVAQCNKNVALLYWELIYHHLVSPEVETLILNKAQSYALAALKVLKNDAALWVLLGKIYKYVKQYDKAEDALLKAFSCKASPAQVLPYFAEMKYNIRDYQAMQYYLSASDSLSDIAQIAPVKRFWGMP
jgi:tetratricopeptide (TPR) repeat protein